MNGSYDIIIFGAGIAGLYIANRLQDYGYNFLLIEKYKVGGTQTLASQGMIHGGQKYVLQGKITDHGISVAKMPDRWDMCFKGTGEIDLSAVRFLSESQLMFPAGSVLSNIAVFAAAKAVNGKTNILPKEKIPRTIKRFPVYEMQEKVVDIKSLITTLSKNIKSKIIKGNLEKIFPDGSVTVSGIDIKAKLIVCTAGIGNEGIFDKLNIDKNKYTQRRPLCQIMVKNMQEALYGHGVVESPKPRVTITSHPLCDKKYIWYLGGNIAEKAVAMSDVEALRFARNEMEDIFPEIDWNKKTWATWRGDRAEPFDSEGYLPSRAHVHQQGNILITWPIKLTFAPALADMILEYLELNNIRPSKQIQSIDLPMPEMGEYVWKKIKWQKI